ncbi:MAG TPA: serine hydroxymethyltransferase [Polyangiaceae bacterium]|nr:serine hydroxymethyltransferase [Polyangiaceae bacterium]
MSQTSPLHAGAADTQRSPDVGHDPAAWSQVVDELFELGRRVRKSELDTINLIASDNAMPAVVSRRPVYDGHIIQEGLVGRRPFAGAAAHDALEAKAVEIACRVFGVEHANVQPHSCSQANQAVYHAILRPGDAVLALGFRAGGHLTHGLSSNFSGRHYRFLHFGAAGDERLDYVAARRLAEEAKPKLIVCGSSSYPRLFDAAELRRIADGVGARLMFDLSHEAGLIAGGALPNIVPIADAATMSTDKTLRGPFGGVILCRRELAAAVDKAVHPGTQSSFPIRKVATTAHCLALTQTPEFRRYAAQVLRNARQLASAFAPGSLFTGGTDKHYIVVNVRQAFGIDGATAEQRLERVGVLSSRQTVPSDSSSKMAEASGLRLGLAWLTSRGYAEGDVASVAEIILAALSGEPDAPTLEALARRAAELGARSRPDDVWADRAH